MKKMKKLLGLLVLSSIIITGCDKKKVSNVVNNSSNVSENNGDNNENNNNNNNENGSGENGTNQDGDNTDNGNGSEYGGDNNGEGGNGENQGNGNGEGGGNGGTVAKTDWDDEEKAIFDDYFYGVEVPYMYIEGESPLDVDLEYGYAYKTAPNSSAELLDSYAALFDDTWIDLYADDEEEIEAPIEDINVLSAPTFDDELDDDDYDLDYEEETYYEYGFSKTIETEAGIRFVYVSLYGGYYDDYGDFVPTADGSGTFTLEIYDPFYYEWPADEVEYVLEVLELTDEVPAYNGADFYEIDDSWFIFGIVAFYCYTDDDNSITTYIEDLMALGYELYDTDEYGCLYYTNENKAITIGVTYDSDYGYLAIIICPYFDESGEQDPYDPDKVDWSDDEKAILNDDFYGVEVPYKNITNENFLKCDEETGFAVKTAPNCSKELLDSYAALFDDSWTDLSVLDDETVEYGYYYYCFKKAITTDEGVRYAFVRFYGGEYDDYGGGYYNNQDGTGTFVLEIYDPFYYAWPDNLVDEWLEYQKLTDEVPAYENAPFYDVDDYYWNYLGIFAYVEKTEVDAYINTLTEAGFTSFYEDADGYVYYTNEAQKISIAVAYGDDDGTLNIYLELYSAVAANIPVVIDLEGDVLDQSFFGLTNGNSNYGDKSATGESGATYSGNMAASHGIQLRSKNKNSGIIASNPDGYIDAIAIAWNTSTTSGKVVEIYASNEPFTIADMYNGNVSKVGEITYDRNAGIFSDFNGEYSYVGIRSADGAVYLDEIIFAWADPNTSVQ